MKPFNGNICTFVFVQFESSVYLCLVSPLKRHSFPTVSPQQLSISIDSGINQKQNKNLFFSYHTIPEDR